MAEQTDHLARGREVVGKLWGARAAGQELPAQRLAPEFFGLVTQFVFGMFWARPNLDLRSRSLCTVAYSASVRSRPRGVSTSISRSSSFDQSRWPGGGTTASTTSNRPRGGSA